MNIQTVLITMKIVKMMKMTFNFLCSLLGYVYFKYIP